MWELLLKLYSQLFGPDASEVPEDGHNHRRVVAAIESNLLDHRDWLDEGQDAATPLNLRANAVLDRLQSSGWLKEERIGVRKYIAMRPAVGKFLEHLKQYAEDGPLDVGGSIQMIHNTLKAANDNPEEQAGAFAQAAKQARSLIGQLNTTYVRVREVMADLSVETSTPQYVRAFFDQYVSDLLIRDYRALRTHNHPLRNRYQMLRLVYDLRDTPEKRERLEAGYRRIVPDPTAMELALQRDFDRLQRFEDIDKYLVRLDRSVTQASTQAVGYISYSMRSRDKIERLIQQAADAICARSGNVVDTPWPTAAQPFSESMLREPLRRKEPAPRVPVVKRQPTVEELAQWNLRRLMNQNREVDARRAKAFLVKQLGRRKRIGSDDMVIEGISDLMMFAAVGRVALQRANSKGMKAAESTLSRALGDFAIQKQGGQTENEYLKAPRFSVALEKV